MQGNNRTRIKGISVLLTLVVSGLFTNCDWCPGPNATGTTAVNPSDGNPEPVAACGNDVHYYHYKDLHEQSCTLTAQGRDASCNFKVAEGAVQRCPGTGTLTPFALTTPFTVFWTICNYADHEALATEVKAYNLQVYQVDPATGLEGTSPFATIPFTQPILPRCGCADVGVNFNNPSESTPHNLPVGTYFFRLDGNYENRSGNGHTRGCDPAGFTKVTIQ